MNFEELKKNGNQLGETDLYNNGIYIGTEYVYEYGKYIYVSRKYTNLHEYSGRSWTEGYTKKEFLQYMAADARVDEGIEMLEKTESLISLAEYAELHGVTHDTIRQRANRGVFKTARKIGRNWVIDKNEPYIDNRKNNKGSDK